MRFLKKGDDKKPKIPIRIGDEGTSRPEGDQRFTNFWAATPTTGTAATAATTATKYHTPQYQV